MALLRLPLFLETHVPRDSSTRRTYIILRIPQTKKIVLLKVPVADLQTPVGVVQCAEEIIVARVVDQTLKVNPVGPRVRVGMYHT